MDAEEGLEQVFILIRCLNLTLRAKGSQTPVSTEEQQAEPSWSSAAVRPVKWVWVEVGEPLGL